MAALPRPAGRMAFGGTTLGRRQLAWAAIVLSVVCSYLIVAVAPAGAATVTTMTPTAAPVTGGTTVTFTGTFRTARRATTVNFGGTAVTGVTCAATTCTVATPRTVAGAVAVTVNDGAGVANAGTFTFRPTISRLSPATGPSTGGTAVGIDGAGFVAGGTTVLFGTRPATSVSCASTTRCDVVSPIGIGNTTVTVVVNGVSAATAGTFAYTSPVPTITSITPAFGPLAGGTAVTIAGTGFFDGATTVRFGTAAPVPAVCAGATSCTATTPAAVATGAVPVVVTVGTQSSAAGSFTYTSAAAPTLTAISPASGALAGGNRVTVTGTNLTGATAMRFGALNGTALTCTATTCSATAPAGAALGNVQVTVVTGPTSNGLTYSYVPTTQAPPVTPHSIIAFPQRDFVSTTGFEIANGPYRIELRSANNALRSWAVDTNNSQQLTPVLVEGVPTLEVNHPGGACWAVNTPDVAPGDQVLVIAANGVTSRITVSGVTATAPVLAPLVGPTAVQVRGRAVDAIGNPLPTDQVEHRFVNPTFVDLGGRRTLRATVAPGSDGTLVIDAAGNYVATYVLGSAEMVAAALDAESRGIWLGADPAAGVDSTIYEVGSLVTAGPAAPCTAPLEPDTFSPTQPTGFTVTMSLDNAHLAWTASTDNRGVDHYEIFRDNALVATTFATTYDDLHVAAGNHTWRVRAVDGAGLLSPPTADVPGTSSLTNAPDLSVSLTHNPTLATVGGNASITLTATNVGTTPTAGLITLTLGLPAGLSATSFSSTEASLSCTIATPVPNAVTCTTSNLMAVGAAFSFVTTASVSAAAFPSATVTASAVTPGDPVLVNNDATRAIAVNVAAVTVNDPPRVDRAIIAFPARDYIGGEGYTPGQPHTVQIIRGSTVVASSRGVLADVDGLIDINHLAPVCWDTVTPRLQPFDVVRIIDQNGIADQTTIANVRTLYAENLGNGTVRVRGIAQDSAGNPIDIGFIEQRIIASSADPFDLNGRRSLGADSTGQGDGLLTYDAPGAVNWTAIYTGLSQHDVDLALTSEARIQWLGRDALLGNELTIYENGPLVAGGPAPGCNAPADTSPLPATPSVTVNVSHSGNFTVGQTDAAYRVRVRNEGDAPTSGAVIAMVDLPLGLIPKGTSAITFSGTAWTCVITGQHLECTSPSSLAVGDDETITIGVNVSGAAVGTVVTTAEIAAGLDRDPAGNWATDPTTVVGAALASDLGIQLTHTGVFTQGVLGLQNVVVANHGSSSVTGLTVTDAVPAGWTFGGTTSAGWTCPTTGTGPITVTCSNPTVVLAAGASTTLVLRLTPAAAPLLAAPVTITNGAAVVNAGDANPSDNTATDAIVVNPNPSEPPTSGVTLIAFSSRDFISAQGFQPSDGPITFRVLRGTTVVSTSTAVPLTDDPSTAAFDGIAEVNHPGGGCWNAVTPDIRPGDKVQAVTQSGVIHQTTVANVEVTGTRRVGTTNVFEVHGIALTAANTPISLDQLEVRIRAGGGNKFLTNDRNTLRAPLDGTLAFDAPGSAAFTARFTVDPGDVAAVTTAETRIHWLGQNPLSAAEATIFEFGAGVAGGPSAPCTAVAGSTAPLPTGQAELSITAVRNGNSIDFTVRNANTNGIVTATNVRIYVVTGSATQVVTVQNVGRGNTRTATVNVAAGTPVFAYVVADQADTNINDSVLYLP